MSHQVSLLLSVVFCGSLATAFIYRNGVGCGDEIIRVVSPYSNLNPRHGCALRRIIQAQPGTFEERVYNGAYLRGGGLQFANFRGLNKDKVEVGVEDPYRHQPIEVVVENVKLPQIALKQRETVYDNGEHERRHILPGNSGNIVDLVDVR